MVDDSAADMHVVEFTELRCLRCDASLNESDRFCRTCGAMVHPNSETDTVVNKWNIVRQLLLFFVIEAAICACSSVKAFHSFTGVIVLDLMSAALAIVFVSLNWSAYRPLLVWHNFSIQRLAIYSLLAIIASYLVSIVAVWLNLSLYSESVSHYKFFLHFKYPVFLTVFFLAVTPAIFEELAFRVFLLGRLLLVTERNQAIIISGFMFAITHMSFISLFWLIPAGIVFGYIRMRQNTMWYGTCIHFCFNLTAVVIDIVTVTHNR